MKIPLPQPHKLTFSFTKLNYLPSLSPSSPPLRERAGLPKGEKQRHKVKICVKRWCFLSFKWCVDGGRDDNKIFMILWRFHDPISGFSLWWMNFFLLYFVVRKVGRKIEWQDVMIMKSEVETWQCGLWGVLWVREGVLDERKGRKLLEYLHQKLCEDF